MYADYNVNGQFKNPGPYILSATGSATSDQSVESAPYISTVNSIICHRNDQWLPSGPYPMTNPPPGGPAYPGPNTSWPCGPGSRLASFRHGTQIMLAYDALSNDGAGDWSGGSIPAEKVRFRHHGGQWINLVFLDGHAESWEAASCQNGADKTYLRNLFDIGQKTLPWSENNVPGGYVMP